MNVVGTSSLSVVKERARPPRESSCRDPSVAAEFGSGYRNEGRLSTNYPKNGYPAKELKRLARQRMRPSIPIGLTEKALTSSVLEHHP